MRLGEIPTPPHKAREGWGTPAVGATANYERALSFRGRGRPRYTKGIMNIREKVRGALRRIAGVSLGDAMEMEAVGSSSFAAGSTAAERGRTVALPSILNTFGYARGGAAWAQAMPKPTPANLRRFAETPVARK